MGRWTLLLLLLLAAPVAAQSYRALPGLGLEAKVPKGWQVVRDGVATLVRESEKVQDVLIPVSGLAPGQDAADLARALQAVATDEFPDLRAEAVRRSPDGRLVTLQVRYTYPDGVPSRAIFVVMVERGQGLIAGYEAPASLFEKKRPALEGVLLSLRAPAAAPRARQARPVDLPLVARRTADGSVSAQAPADWQVQGGGGTSMRVTKGAGEPIGAAVDGFQAVTGGGLYPNLIVAPHATGGDCLAGVYLPAAGATDVRVLGQWPAEDYVRAHAPQYAQFGVGVEAWYVLADFVRGGHPARGFFLMATTTPVRDMSGAGVWTGFAQGFWCPPERFPSLGPLLLKVAGSFRISGEYAAGVLAVQWGDIQSRLGAVSATLAETTEIVNRGYDGRQQVEQRRYDTSQRYAAGEEGYRSESDDRIYMLPENYETWRQNPRTGEWMTTVTPDEWSRLPVDRSLMR